MKPSRSFRSVWFFFAVIVFLMSVPPGCHSPIWRSQSPDGEILPSEEPDEAPLTVGDYTRTWGLSFVKVESVALVTNLKGTGSDPAPTAQRAELLRQIQVRGVHNSTQLLASPSTSLVYTRAYLPPGVQKGDWVDVEISIPSRSETTDLAGGWLMASQLRQMQVLGGRIRTGDVLCLAEGPILVDSLTEGTDDPVTKTCGRVLAGGVATESRSLGLFLKNEYHSVRTSMLVGAAINNRFFMYDRGTRLGVADPKRPEYIELRVHPRYRSNVTRFVRVIQTLVVKETPDQHVARMQRLERELHDPETSAKAALALEGIGKEAVSILKTGLQSDNEEIRFYAAEALAYLDVPESAPELVLAARHESAFRWNALTALSAMDCAEAHDSLLELLNVSSAETRYGTFRALCEMNPYDPAVRGESMDGRFMFHKVQSSAEPMIHVARTRRPELVLFGDDVRLEPGAPVFAGKNILVKNLGGGQVKICRFEAGKDDEYRVCSSRLEDVVVNVVALGGTYPEIVQMIQESKRNNGLQARVVFDALPRPGRIYHRDGSDLAPVVQAEDAGIEIALPDMFARAPDTGSQIESADSPTEEITITDENVGKAEQDPPADGQTPVFDGEEPAAPAAEKRPAWDVFGRMKDSWSS